VRVACVNQDPGVAPGRRKGAAVHLESMRRAFAQLGCDVVAIDASDAAGLERELECRHAEGELDFVYERHALGATAAALFCRRANVPLFLEVNAPLVEEAREHRGHVATPRELAGETFVLATAQEVFAVSAPLADWLAGRGVERRKLHVTPNGVDLEQFRPTRTRPAGLDLPPNAFVIGFHGRLRPWHNFPLLAKAFELLAMRGYPVHLLAVGEGAFHEAVAPELRSRVSARGWRSAGDLAAHVATFHALPLSYAPGAACYFSPLKLLEAMACGVVPVVPELGDLPAAVDFGRAGIVVPPGDARALADALAGLIEWPEVRERLARAAVERASRRSWLEVAREVLEFAPRERVR
jgi:glycosyltransferase involved in cell wall biosynthesis